MTEIWWIRHGESDSNAGARTASASAPVLTELGWRQARATAAVFEAAPARVVTSPFVRTRQTAQPLLERFPGVAREEWAVQEFEELSHRNRANTASPERRPLVDAYWERSDPDYCDGEGAESFRDLLGRVDAAWERVRRAGEGRTVVFSHGLFMRAMVWQAWRNSAEISPQTMRAFIYFYMALPLPNCAIIRFQPGPQSRWLMAAPDIGHLGVVTAQPGEIDP